MSATLDLDDVAAGNPVALRELAELRAEIERLRAECDRAWREVDATARERDASLARPIREAKP